MAKAKGITTRTVRLPTKVTPVWQIGIIFPNGNKIMKPKCTLNEIFLTYFLDLEKHLNKGYSPEQLLELYKKTYIDSWGHKWTGKVAWPKEDKFIEFLNKKINND